MNVDFVFFFPIENFFQRLKEFGVRLSFCRVRSELSLNVYVFSSGFAVTLLCGYFFFLAFLKDKKNICVFMSQMCLNSVCTHSILYSVKLLPISSRFDFYVFFYFRVLT